MENKIVSNPLRYTFLRALRACGPPPKWYFPDL